MSSPARPEVKGFYSMTRTVQRNIDDDCSLDYSYLRSIKPDFRGIYARQVSNTAFNLLDGYDAGFPSYKNNTHVQFNDLLGFLTNQISTGRLIPDEDKKQTVPSDFIGIRETFARIMSRAFVHDPFELYCQKVANSIYLMDKKKYDQLQVEPRNGQARGGDQYYGRNGEVQWANQNYRANRQVGNRRTKPDFQFLHKQNYARMKLKQTLTEYYCVDRVEDDIERMAGNTFNYIYGNRISSLDGGNSYKILYSGEVDAIKNRQFRPDAASECLLFKIRKDKIKPPFRETETLFTDSWSNAHLSGINNVLVAYRDDSFVVNKISNYSTNFLRSYRHDRRNRCLESLYGTLDSIYTIMQNYDDGQVCGLQFQRANDTQLRPMTIYENEYRLLNDSHSNQLKFRV